ncbi:hypothetical protein VB713_05575 [Anabaena cylindrica UHCC 0172]|uniref:hypothetical protein n=1 Tax=Anabaena cylindrica TaxID=1165 RepID=UPI002B1F6110|nr:hypothetical protein [Anabaena cylindrica]MEA5550452.1 hypothetical protein [Anabaena cylindrica UHCC 0172]
MKSIYPISISSYPANCQANWEFAAVEVEYLFMADGSQHQRQNTEGNDDFRYISFDGLISKPQIDTRSGRYKRINAVPQ